MLNDQVKNSINIEKIRINCNFIEYILDFREKGIISMNRIVPCLWFASEAEEAASFYISLFKNSKINYTTRYGKEGYEIHQQAENSIMTVSFQIDGQKFLALNGGPIFKFSEAVSFYVYCGSVNEINRLYERLSENGQVLMPLDKYDWSEKYAWVKDRFGLSWQLDVHEINYEQKIVPSLLFVNKKFDKVRDAVNYFSNIFPDSRKIMEAPYGSLENVLEGTLLFAQFAISNYLMNAISSIYPHQFDFNEAISFIIYCKTQKEIDYYWEKFTHDGEEGACGWLKDKFGISWQVVPEILEQLLLDPSRAGKVTEAYLKMKKFEIEKLLII